MLDSSPTPQQIALAVQLPAAVVVFTGTVLTKRTISELIQTCGVLQKGHVLWLGSC